MYEIWNVRIKKFRVIYMFLNLQIQVRTSLMVSKNSKIHNPTSLLNINLSLSSFNTVLFQETNKKLRNYHMKLFVNHSFAFRFVWKTYAIIRDNINLFKLFLSIIYRNELIWKINQERILFSKNKVWTEIRILNRKRK